MTVQFVCSDGCPNAYAGCASLRRTVALHIDGMTCGPRANEIADVLVDGVCRATRRHGRQGPLVATIVGSVLIAAGLLLVAARPSAAGKADTARLELPVAGMACEGCAAQISKKVGALAGVVSVGADHDKARVVVVYRPARITPGRIRGAIRDAGYVIGRVDPPVVYPRGADVRVISKAGEDVRVGRHLARGKVTIVDFYADWCRPCKALDRRLAARVAKHPNGLAVRKVNIVDWDTPVAKRYLRNVAGLPYIRIYDRRGTLAAALAQGDVDRLDHVLATLSTTAGRK